MLILISIIPVIIFFAVIYYRDKEKEPLSLLLKSFIGGALGATTLTILVVYSMPDFRFSHPFSASFYDAFFTAAIPEELSKFIFLYLIVWKNKEFDEYYDGIVYAVTVSLGFACVENILYVTEGGFSVGITRALLSIPLHGFMGVLMGYYFSLAKFKRRNFLLYKGIIAAIIGHGLYDFFVFYMEKTDKYLSFFLFLVFIYFNYRVWKLGIHKIKVHVEKDAM